MRNAELVLDALYFADDPHEYLRNSLVVLVCLVLFIRFSVTALTAFSRLFTSSTVAIVEPPLALRVLMESQLMPARFLGPFLRVVLEEKRRRLQRSQAVC